MTLALPYQAEGAAFLATRAAAMLADQPGLGKTFQAIRACDERIVLSVLVICPASVIGTWHAEIAKFREGDWTAFVTSFERACGSDLERILSAEWDVLIIDEAHYLKTVTSKRAKTIYGFTAIDGLRRLPAIIDRCAAVWLLTATPMPNDPSELYPHLRALAPDAVRSERTGDIWSFHQFIGGYCRLKQTGFGQSIVGAKNEAKLNRKLGGFMLRRKKDEVLKDLPPLRFGEIAIEGDVSALPAEEVAMVRAALAKGGYDALRELLGHVGVLRRVTGLAKLPGVVAWVKDWLASVEADRKIVLFAHHRDVIAGLRESFGTLAVTLAGDTPQAQRETARERFQGDPKVRIFIGQIQAAGTGITLTAASDLVFVESSWVPAEIEQASQRIHRLGQTEKCLVRFAHLAGSIDEDIQRAVRRKVGMISRVIDGGE